MTRWPIAVVVALLTLICPLVAPAASPPSDPYAPLWIYTGSWQVTRAGAAPETLVNECARIGTYLGCQQTVNGSVVGLLIIIPAKEPGHYYTQTVLPQGRATGLGELEIAGDRWTFVNSEPGNGKVTHYRTVNTFTGKTHIHFEQAVSGDGNNWTVTGTGETVKRPAAK
jgi:hypothetical protein